ncbi:MAG: Fur family transcriptional regulator [Fidelibacterota bacterium]
MRYSHQRERILEIVQSTVTHPTADWVYDQVRLSIPNISLGTVYRNLNQLVQQGRVKAIHDESVVRYDGKTNPHAHFKCLTCLKIYDVDWQDDSLPHQIADEYGHLPTRFTLNITGVCKTCSAG